MELLLGELVLGGLQEFRPRPFPPRLPFGLPPPGRAPPPLHVGAGVALFRQSRGSFRLAGRGGAGGCGFETKRGSRVCMHAVLANGPSASTPWRPILRLCPACCDPSCGLWGTGWRSWTNAIAPRRRGLKSRDLIADRPCHLRPRLIKERPAPAKAVSTQRSASGSSWRGTMFSNCL